VLYSNLNKLGEERQTRGFGKLFHKETDTKKGFWNYVCTSKKGWENDAGRG